jgi:hypothetical protein
VLRSELDRRIRRRDAREKTLHRMQEMPKGRKKNFALLPGFLKPFLAFLLTRP